MKKLRQSTTLSVGGVVLLLALWLTHASVAAHALLVRSLPAANAALAAPPPTIELWFSEELEPQFSQAYLVDTAGTEIGRGSATVDPADPKHLTLPLPALGPGIYTVVYRTLSRADGHEWLGSFPLTILRPDGSHAHAKGPSVGVSAQNQGKALPTPLQFLSRWLGLIGGMLAFGACCFVRFAPKAADSAATQAVMRAVQRAIKLTLLVGISLLLAGSWLQLAIQVRALGDRGALTDLLLQTRSGNLLLSRQLLAGGLLFVTIKGFAQRSGIWWLGFVLSSLILVTFSVGSHAAGVVGSGWAILGDLIHLTAAALWLGGLVLLAYLCWQLRQPRQEEARLTQQIVRRFSIVATLAVFVLVVTGLFSSLVQLDAVNLLWRSTYGWLLLAKVGLVLVTLGLALRNHRLVRRPQAVGSAWSGDDYRTFQRQLWGESCLGLLIMLVVALLVQTPIPQPATSTEASAAAYFDAILTADDLTIHLQISPNQVGENRYTAHLYHADNSPIGEVQLVRLTLVHQSGELGQTMVALEPQGDNLFTASGAYQNRSGSWDLSVYVRRRGLDDSLVNTVVTVPEVAAAVVTTPVRQTWQNPLPALPVVTVFESAIFALVLGLLLWRYAAKQPNIDSRQ